MPRGPLISATAAARALQQAEPGADWQPLVWAMIAEDDLSGAYWLTRSLAASGSKTPVPDWLLAALLGSRWLTEASQQLVVDLQGLSQLHTPNVGGALGLLGLAAALKPTLMAPASGMLAWVETPTSCPALTPLVEAVKDLARLGIALTVGDVKGAAGAQQRDDAARKTAQAAKRWMEEASSKTMKIKRATDVWRNLTGPEGELRKLLVPVGGDNRSKQAWVGQEVARWQWSATHISGRISSRIDEIDRALTGGGNRPIVASPRDALMRNIQEALTVAARWREQALQVQVLEADGGWIAERIASFRSALEPAVATGMAGLRRLRDDCESAVIHAAISCLMRSVTDLLFWLQLPGEGTESERGQYAFAMETPPVDAKLQESLARRLVWCPELTLADDGMPLETSFRLSLALRDAVAAERSLVEAVQGWVKSQDYRFVGDILAAMEPGVRTGELDQEYRHALEASRVALRAACGEVGAAIEQALADDVIAAIDHAEHNAVVASILVEEERNCRLQQLRLAEVQSLIDTTRRNRVSELHRRWSGIKAALAVAPVELEKREQAVAAVETALARQDTRIAEECLSRVEEVLDGGGTLPGPYQAPGPKHWVLEDYKREAPQIETMLEQRSLDVLARSISEGHTLAGVQFGQMPAPRRKEVHDAITAWRRLKQPSPTRSDIHSSALGVLLRYLGFSPSGAEFVGITASGDDWVHVRAKMSASDLSRPIPQFGSQAHGSYDVVCLWERPGAESIAARLRELHVDLHHVLVLYLGRLTERQRRDAVRVSRDGDLPLAILDETLLFFLAREEDERLRLPLFLRCSLPYSALNPYTPGLAGDVPPEMFFGRDSMARELLKPGGSCIVYGGRQLGKSALLRHVQRQFHHPLREQYAWLENMNLVYDPTAGRGLDNIWRVLRDGFKHQDLWPKKIVASRPEDIAKHIRDVLIAVPSRRVLVMLDEADAFLDADAGSAFGMVTALGNLMLETERRFKIVFSGLHNVQRFQGMPNQPLAHFGAPLKVGPLEPDAAQRLVLEPLECLGFRFADEASPLRILSYTNYHPGLIQYYCEELLRHVRNQTSNLLPPYQISQTDVEAVYRKEEIRERIRERFDWTLALDTHYKAIAWSLIQDQVATHDSYARAYPPSQLAELASSWWPAGFEATTLEQTRGWLDEMCGLGVLVRNSQGHYRLRSPNLVRLMGTGPVIEGRLLELLEKPAPASPSEVGLHAPLDSAGDAYSPLTYSQERSLFPMRSGIGLVFGSPALGLARLPTAFSRHIPADLPPGLGICREIPGVLTSSAAIGGWLEDYRREYRTSERLIAFMSPKEQAPHQLLDLVDGALTYCERREWRNQWLRVIFIFDQEATWRWLSVDLGQRQTLETGADAALWPRQWGDTGVLRRLRQHDKWDSPEIVAVVLKSTGGWPTLLDELFDRGRQVFDLRTTCAELSDELGRPGAPLRTTFQTSLGIAGFAGAQRVWEFVLRNTGKEGVPADLVPGFLGGEPGLTASQCQKSTEFLTRLGLLQARGNLLLSEPISAQLAPVT